MGELRIFANKVGSLRPPRTTPRPVARAPSPPLRTRVAGTPPLGYKRGPTANSQRACAAGARCLKSETVVLRSETLVLKSETPLFCQQSLEFAECFALFRRGGGQRERTNPVEPAYGARRAVSSGSSQFVRPRRPPPGRAVAVPQNILRSVIFYGRIADICQQSLEFAASPNNTPPGSPRALTTAPATGLQARPRRNLLTRLLRRRADSCPQN
jgi:hypothetical protein